MCDCKGMMDCYGLLWGASHSSVQRDSALSTIKFCVHSCAVAELLKDPKHRAGGEPTDHVSSSQLSAGCSICPGRAGSCQFRLLAVQALNHWGTAVCWSRRCRLLLETQLCTYFQPLAPHTPHASALAPFALHLSHVCHACMCRLDARCFCVVLPAWHMPGVSPHDTWRRAQYAF